MPMSDNLATLNEVVGGKGSNRAIAVEVDRDGEILQGADWFTFFLMSSLEISAEESETFVTGRNQIQIPIAGEYNISITYESLQKSFNSRNFNLSNADKYIALIIEDSEIGMGAQGKDVPYIFLPIVRIPRTFTLNDDDTQNINLQVQVNQDEITLALNTITMEGAEETGFISDLASSGASVVVPAGQGIALFTDDTEYTV